MTAKRYEDAASKRQAALDYINDHPGSLGPDVCEALGWKQDVGTRILARMSDMGELLRLEAVMTRPNELGVLHSQRTHAYTARVRVTEPATQVLTRTRKRTEPGKWVGGNYRNVNDDRACIANQGGQGAARPRNYSSLEYI